MSYEIVENDEIECLSPKNVGELLGLSKSEAYKIFHSADFNSFYISERTIRITKRDFKLWINKKKGEKKYA